MYPAYKRSIKALNRGICSKNNREKYGEDFINDSFVKIPFYGVNQVVGQWLVKL